MIRKLAKWVYRHPMESLAYQTLCCMILVSIRNLWLKLVILAVELSLLFLGELGERYILEDLYAGFLQVVEEAQKEHDLLYGGCSDSDCPGRTNLGQNDPDGNTSGDSSNDLHNADDGLM